MRLTGETKSDLPRYYYSVFDTEISPVWTRDGKEILFISNRGHIHGSGGFWRMRAEPGAEAHEIHYEETNWKARPDFSPDGSRMVYSSYLGRTVAQRMGDASEWRRCVSAHLQRLGLHKCAVVARRKATCVHYKLRWSVRHAY